MHAAMALIPVMRFNATLGMVFLGRLIITVARLREGRVIMECCLVDTMSIAPTAHVLSEGDLRGGRTSCRESWTYGVSQLKRTASFSI